MLLTKRYCVLVIVNGLSLCTISLTSLFQFQSAGASLLSLHAAAFEFMFVLGTITIGLATASYLLASRHNIYIIRRLQRWLMIVGLANPFLLLCIILFVNYI